MRVGLAIAVVAFAAGCQSTEAPKSRETRAELPTRSYVSVLRLADRLDLDYLGEADGCIEMAAPPDYIMLVRDSKSAVINGERLALAQPCLLRGSDYVLTAGDADLVTSTLSVLRSRREPTEPVAPPAAAPAAHLSGLPAEWQPRAGAQPRAWRAIVIHHAAVRSGDAASLHRAHLSNGWDGLGYHFVVGNGTASGDGQVEMGFRWRDQLKGAHTRARAGDDNRWNLSSIGICLVGDFTTAPPSPRQMDALVRLVRALMAEYQVPPSAVVPHHFVHATECPGARFPWAEFMARIR